MPNELWNALPEAKQKQIGKEANLTEPLLQVLPAWVKHGAMWRTLRERYHDARLPDGLEDKPVTDDVEIRKILKDWHDNLDPDRIIGDYEQRFHDAQNLSQEQQFRAYIHGAKFFDAVVVPTLNKLLAQSSREKWLQQLSEDLQSPDDIKAFLDEIYEIALRK